jgi:Zn-dependent peptidase ImmA (M78 family)/transcriptional regulator with XRE-family HTH domain
MATTDNIVAFTQTPRGTSAGRRLNPTRLRDARIAKRLNQSELAAIVGVTRQAISAYEQGEKAPEAATLSQIAAALGQPLAFFTAQDRPGFGPFGARFFRAVGAETKRRNRMSDVYANWMVQTAHYFDDMVNYPPVSLPSFTPGNPDGSYTAEEIEEAAAECRKAWGLGLGPLSNVLALLEGKGVVSARLRMVGERVEAFSFWNGARPFVFLASEKESAARARYDVAHECGHLVLHRGVGQEDVEDPKVLRRIEDEANRFAGALLLPRQSFPNEVFTTRLDAFVELKMRWKVSIQAMVYRCKDLGVFDEYQITNLYKQISARKWRTKEPLDDPNSYPLEQPKLLRRAVTMVLDANRKTPDDLAAELALAPGIVETLCNLDEGTLSAVEPMLPQPSLR